MQVNEDFFEFLRKAEGFRECPYRDGAGVPTIGIGSTYYEDGTKVKMTDICISFEKAIQLVKNVLPPYENFVNLKTPAGITQNQYNALVSFAYNLGTDKLNVSTLLKKVIKDPGDPSIEQEFLKWNKIRNPKTKQLDVSDGLTHRRQKEWILYSS